MSEARWTIRRCAGAIAAALPFLLVAGGCGDLTSGGFGELEVEMAADSVPDGGATADPRTPFQSAAGSDAAGAASLAGLDHASLILEGRLSAEVRVLVRRGVADWEEVTDGPQEVVLFLGEGGTGLVARDDFPAGRYDRVAIVFTRVEVDVVRGLVVDGDTIRGRIRVELESDRRIGIVRRLDLEVRQGRTSVLLLEMRASRWLRRVDRLRRVVDAVDFRELFRVRVREGS